MLGLVVALLTYYFIHEGAHFLYALSHGVFKAVHFMGFGIQIDIHREMLTDSQLGWFCLAGPIATLICAALLIGLCKQICSMKSAVLKACCWYISLIMLLLDPLYLSLIYRWVGGGDMNGIRMLVPEVVAAAIFTLILLANIILIFRLLLPRYKAAFAE